MSGLEAVALVLNASDIGQRLLTAAYDYGKKVRNAQEQTERLRREVEQLLKVLGDIHTRAVALESSDGTASQKNSFESLKSDGSPLIQLLADLKSLLNLLGSRKLSKIEQMVWPRKCAKLNARLSSIANQRRLLMDKILVDVGSVSIYTYGYMH